MRIQERIGAFEAEAKGRIRRVLTNGNARLLELDKSLGKVAKDDWTVPGMRRQIDHLVSRAHELRVNAEKRVQEIPGDAVTRIATATRAPLQNLAKGLAEIAKKLEPPAPRAVKPVEGEAKGEKVAKTA